MLAVGRLLTADNNILSDLILLSDGTRDKIKINLIRRHTGPELHTGGMRGSKPAGFSSTGE
jgi:hypothetical protein